MARGEIDRQDDDHRRVPVKEQAPETDRNLLGNVCFLLAR